VNRRQRAIAGLISVCVLIVGGLLIGGVVLVKSQSSPPPRAPTVGSSAATTPTDLEQFCSDPNTTQADREKYCGVPPPTSTPIPSTPEQSAPVDRELSFGQIFHGARSTVMMSEPTTFTPSETAAADPGRHVALTVTVENQGTDVMLAYEFISSAACGGVTAPEIYDTENGLEGLPPSDVLPGRKVSWKIGYTVPQQKCELIVTLTFGADSLYFVGTI
jgi:hypothetical protein